MDSPLNAKATLLQVLVSGEGYGLELIDRVAKRTGGKMKLHEGSVYPALRSLERDGFIKSFDGAEPVPERGGRPRRYYKLTAKGAKAVSEQTSIITGLLRPATEGA